jgi:protein TonB
MKRTHLGNIAVVVAAAALLSACGKNEAPAAKAREAAPTQVANAAPEATPQVNTAEANEALKERLARQEAATKLFDKSKPEPPPPPAPVAAAPKAAPAPAPAAAATTPARAEPQRQPEIVRTAATVPPPVQPVPAAAPAKLPEAAPAKAPEAVKAEPAKPEPVRLASAAPTTLPAPPTANAFAAKLVSRVDPEFPREAVQAGAEKGNVKARMTLDGNGNVTRVEIDEANPRRVFDRAVVRALSQWRFSDGPSGRTVESEVEFKR